MAFLVLVVGLMAYFPETRIALYVGPAFLALLVVLYKVFNLASAKDMEVLGDAA
ncbi:hypothetical protein FQZ97_700680 [compost metagenome]